MMTSKMTAEEFEGYLKKFNISAAEACNLIWIKTKAVLQAHTLNQHIERYGTLSAANTAAFRFLFKDLERDHEHTT